MFHETRKITKKNYINLLPGSLSRPVSLPPVLEPVGDLGGGEPGALGQLPLLAGGGVRVVGVPVAENLQQWVKVKVGSNYSH